MNQLTKIHASRRSYSGVARVPTPPDLAIARGKARRALVCAWTLEPLSGRLICTWSQRLSDEAERPAPDADDQTASKIPIAA
jgi:hypothetical protein